MHNTYAWYIYNCKITLTMQFMFTSICYKSACVNSYFKKYNFVVSITTIIS